MRSGQGALPISNEWYNVGALKGYVGMHAEVWHSIMWSSGPADNFGSYSSGEQLSQLSQSLRK